jgi:hypothetical protein
VPPDVLPQLRHGGHGHHKGQRGSGSPGVKGADRTPPTEPGLDQEVHIGHPAEELEEEARREGQKGVLGSGDAVPRERLTLRPSVEKHLPREVHTASLCDTVARWAVQSATWRLGGLGAGARPARHGRCQAA